jgi:hypothetical protein
MARKIVIILKVIILIVLVLIIENNLVYAQDPSSPSEFFIEKLRKNKEFNCKGISNEYLLSPIIEFVLKPFEMEGWIKILEKNSNIRTTVRHGYLVDTQIEFLCIDKRKFDNEFQPLLEKQAKMLDDLVLVFYWAYQIMEKQRSLLDRFVTTFWGDPYISEPLEKILEKPNICIELLGSFIGSTRFGDHRYLANLVNSSNDNYIKGLIQEGLRLGTIKEETEAVYSGAGPGGGAHTLEKYYVFDINKIRNREGDDEYTQMVNSVRDFINQYNNFKNSIKNSASALYNSYKNINNNDALNKFASSTKILNKKIQNYKNNYMVGIREITTCYHFLSVIIKGQTEAGKNIGEFNKDILKPQMQAIEEAKKNLEEAVNIIIKTGSITVTTTEVSIAVIPPVVWSDEHLGTKTLAAITPERVFNEVRNFVFSLAPFVFTILLLAGALFYLLSPFDIEKIKTGSEYIKWAVFGYFLLLIITSILLALRFIFGGP